MLHSEWGRLPRRGERLMGFSRSALYRLAAEKRIVAKSLCREGRSRGLKFIHLPSLAALIQNAAPDGRADFLQ
jgi:hypothetical protein